MNYLHLYQKSALRNAATLFLLVPLGISYFILAGKQALARRSHKIASLSSHYLDEIMEYQTYRPKTGRIPKDKADLLKMLKTGEAFVTKAVYFKNGSPVCFMDVSGQAHLAPQSVTTAPPDFPSSIAFTRSFPPCGAREKTALAHNIQNFVPEGTEVAVYPAIMFFGGCLIAGVEEVIELAHPDDDPFWRKVTIFTVLTGITGAGIVGESGQHSKTTLKTFGRIGARMLGGITLGYLLCGKVASYAVETWVKPKHQQVEQEAEYARLRESYFTISKEEAKKTLITATTQKEQLKKSDRICQEFIAEGDLRQIVQYSHSTCIPSPQSYAGSGAVDCTCAYSDRIDGAILYWK